MQSLTPQGGDLSLLLFHLSHNQTWRSCPGVVHLFVVGVVPERLSTPLVSTATLSSVVELVSPSEVQKMKVNNKETRRQRFFAPTTQIIKVKMQNNYYHYSFSLWIV